MKSYLLKYFNLLSAIKNVFSIRISIRYMHKNIQFKKIKIILHAIRL